MFGFGKTRKIEKQMADWLAHPNEFGVGPKSVQFKKTYKHKLISLGNVEIHLVAYHMPDGTVGRGFVNGPLTWSFLGDGVNGISDDELVLAYCGWAWLFPALQAGTVQTKFVSEEEEEKFKAKMTTQGIEELQITGRLKIGTSELFEFTGKEKGRPIKGAGDCARGVTFQEGDPRAALPPIYFLLGCQVIEDLA